MRLIAASVASTVSGGSFEGTIVVRIATRMVRGGAMCRGSPMKQAKNQKTPICSVRRLSSRVSAANGTRLSAIVSARAVPV